MVDVVGFAPRLQHARVHAEFTGIRVTPVVRLPVRHALASSAEPFDDSHRVSVELCVEVVFANVDSTVLITRGEHDLPLPRGAAVPILPFKKAA